MLALAAPAAETNIDTLLADPRFAREVAPEVLLHGPATAPQFMDPYFLRTTRAGGRVIYHLRKPCSVDVAVSVKPWWDQANPVLVCPDSYRPERKKSPQGWYCGGELLAPNVREPNTQFCGCGPGLMHCVPDAKVKAELLASARRETVATIAHIVATDEKVGAVFSANETVRDRYAEFLYARARVLAGELDDLPDLSDWPLAQGKLAPRVEAYAGQHAGILTTPHIIRSESTPRASMRHAYELMWCKPPESVGVDSQQVFALGVTDLREGEGWKKLAAMPVCTHCHARLDYGMQFFGGLLDVRRATDFISSEPHPATARLFGNAIDDDRGEGVATPRGFAELAMRQPEFGKCMTQRVLEHVFDRGWSPASWNAVSAAFAKEGTFRAMMRTALQMYATEGGSLPDLQIVAAGPGDTVALPAALRGLVDDACGNCHGSGARDLTGETVPVATVHAMLRNVSSGRMPKKAIESSVRGQLVGALVDLLWKDDGDRAEARAYFVDLERGLPVHRYSAVVNAVDAATGAANSRTSFPGSTDLNAGLAAAMAGQALKLCSGIADRAARTACLERATDPALALKGTASSL